MMDTLLIIWRNSLIVLAIFNISTFLYIITTLTSIKNNFAVIAGIPYIFQTTWRCFFISEYVNRQTIYFTKWNSPLVARLLAFLGEFCFGIQLSMTFWKRWNVHPGLPSILSPTFVCISLVLLNFTGQLCATTGIALRDNFFFLLEGMLWAVMFVLQILSALDHIVLPYYYHSIDESIYFWMFLLFASFFAILYQTMLYCPMCYYDWKVQRHNRSLSIRNIFLGLQDAHSKQRVTRRWKDWKNEWIWQSLYFSFGTWACLYMMI